MAINLVYIYTVVITLIYIVSLFLFYRKTNTKHPAISHNQITNTEKITNPVFTIVYEKDEIVSEDIPELASFVIHFSKITAIGNNSSAISKEEPLISINKSNIQFQKLKFPKL